MIDFDEWRRDYDWLSYDQHVDFYRRVADAYPEQKHYNEPAVRAFLDGCRGPVLELGGWKGELAHAVLPDYPNIPEWLNVEIAPQAVTHSVCSDPRYTPIVPDDFIWNADIDLSRFRVLIASHVLEHMKIHDVVKLLDRTLMIHRLYVDAPLPGEPSVWEGGESSHIIETGWRGLHGLIIEYGFHKIGEYEHGKWGPAFWYSR